MTAAYYNEHDPGAAAWLRELIKANLIAPGEVDERDIQDVLPNELTRYTQCHFFAGVGVWSYALRCAGWPDDRPVWTGSCPCQPFSTAGGRNGFDDERHLWPAFFYLISVNRPDVVFGEQVASKDGLAWLDLVQADLEAASYAVGALDLCAAGVGAPHIRQRFFFVAESDSVELRRKSSARNKSLLRDSETSGGLAYTETAERGRSGRKNNGGRRTAEAGRSGPVNNFWRRADWIGCRDGLYRPIEPGVFPLAHGTAARLGRLRGYGNAIVAPLAEEFIRAYLEVKANS